MVDAEKIIREYIDKTVHMSLATVADNKPWVCEVHFAYDDNLNLYFISAPHTRHVKELLKNPNVAGNIVKQYAKGELPHGCIYFEGKAEVFKHSDEDILRYCNMLERDEAMVRNWLSAEGGLSMYKISVSNWAVFGKFEDSLKKYELKWGTTTDVT